MFLNFFNEQTRIGPPKIPARMFSYVTALFHVLIKHLLLKNRRFKGHFMVVFIKNTPLCRVMMTYNLSLLCINFVQRNETDNLKG